MNHPSFLCRLIISLMLTTAIKTAFPQAETWHKTNYPNTRARILALKIDLDGHLFAASLGTGVWRSTDNGETWQNVSAGMSNLEIWSLAIHHSGRPMYAGNSKGEVWRSSDGGGTWTSGDTRFSSPVAALAVHPNGFIFAGTGRGMCHSADLGASWYEINKGLTNTKIRALAVGANQVVFAGTADGGVFRSGHNGSIWIAVNNGLTDMRVTALAANLQGHIFAGTSQGVFRSTDDGNSWSSLTDKYVLSLAVNMQGHIFAGTIGDGVFRSLDNGETWADFNSGLPKASVHSLVINKQDKIFAGTTEGLFAAELKAQLLIRDLAKIVRKIDVKKEPVPSPAPAPQREKKDNPLPQPKWEKLDLPYAKIKTVRKDKSSTSVKVQLAVINWQEFPEAAFAPAPSLPPCDKIKNASRTVVEVYDAESKKRLHTFCTITSPKQLAELWFTYVNQPGHPLRVYLIFIDRGLKKTSQSATASLSAPTL
jgi:ligand-binding sensor domain-containing protein